MANGINRIFDIIHNTSEETNPTTSKTITMTVKSTQPLIFERDDKLEITEDFCIFDNLIDKTTFSVGDMVTAFVFSNGQQYYIQVNTLSMQNLIKQIILEDNKQKYHIGKIIMDTSNTNPATYLGFGTWQYWGSGRVPVGVDTNDTAFDTVEETGGEKTHTLITNELPSHSHEFTFYKHPMQASSQYTAGSIYTSMTTGVTTAKGATDTKGSGNAHNNLQPYITCYMWKRIS